MSFAVFLILFCAAGTCLAVDDIEQVNMALDQESTPQPEDNYLLISFVKLVAVLVVIILAVWLVIRLFSKQIRSRMQGSWLRIIDEVSLGQNRGVVLCEIGGKIYALGVTDHQINLLFDLEDPDLIADIELAGMEAATAGDTASTGWEARINHWLSLLGGKHYQRNAAPRDFHRLVQEQGRRMKDIYENDVHIERYEDKKKEQ